MKKKKNHRFISGFQARISRNRIESKHSEDSKSNLRIKPGEKVKNLPLSYSRKSTSPNKRGPVGIQKVRFKKNETLIFFFKTVKDFRVYNVNQPL